MSALGRLAFGLCMLALAGCGGPPSLHPVSGKITLGGKPYDRLVVYFRPISGEVTMYNLAAGITDKDGKLAGVKCSAGEGLQTGTYRITFVCMVQPSTNQTAPAGVKLDDKGAVAMKELVPPPYDDATSAETSPLTFTVNSGANDYVFDIPAK